MICNNLKYDNYDYIYGFDCGYIVVCYGDYVDYIYDGYFYYLYEDYIDEYFIEVLVENFVVCVLILDGFVYDVDYVYGLGCGYEVVLYGDYVCYFVNG